MRIFLYFLVFTALLLVLLWLLQVVFLDEFYHWQKKDMLRGYSESIVRNIDNANLESLVERIAEQNNVCVLITDPGMQELYSAERFNGCILHRMDRFSLRRYTDSLQEQGGIFIEEFPLSAFRNRQYDPHTFLGRVPPMDRGDARSMLTVQRAQLQNGQTVFVFLNTLITPLASTVETIQNEMKFISIILVALSFVISLLLSRRITEPIVQTTAAASSLSRGEYQPVPNAGYREIAQLNQQLCQTAQDLHRVEQMQQELIANISHDLRTPLTLIEGYAEAIRDLPDENTPENMQVIIDEARRLTTLVNAVLDLNQVRNGGDSAPAELNLTQVIRSIIIRYEKLLQQDGYHMVFEPAEELCVWADEIKAQQVLCNLLNNALTYTGADKTVVVRQMDQGEYVRVEIADSGEGIAEADLPFIWDRYYRGSKPHKRAAVGSGLGLSIVKGILEQTGLPYGVESQLGQGSIFWFALRKAGK